MCNVTRHEITLSSKSTFSPVFITRRIEFDSKVLFHSLVHCVVKSVITRVRWEVQGG